MCYCNDYLLGYDNISSDALQAFALGHFHIVEGHSATNLVIHQVGFMSARHETFIVLSSGDREVRCFLSLRLCVLKANFLQNRMSSSAEKQQFTVAF